MPQQLEKLKIKAFRGASNFIEISFDPNFPASMIFGENGTGKSSIVDAIDFVCNGKLGSLDFCKLGTGQRKDKFIPTLGKLSSDVEIELLFSGKTWSAKLGRSGPILCETADRPKAWILRRTELLGFVDADPADRYRQLASYITVQEIEQAEASLRDSNNLITRQLHDSVRATEQAHAALQDFWKHEGNPGLSQDEWICSEATKDVSTLTNTVKDCRELITVGTRVKSCFNNRVPAQERSQFAIEALTKAQELLTEASRSFATGAATLLEVIKSAARYLVDSPSVTECPVCEKGIDATQVSLRLIERTAELKHLDDLTKSRDLARKAKDVALAQLAHANHAFFDECRNLAILVSKSALSDVTVLKIDWQQFGRLVNPSAPLNDPTVTSEAELFYQLIDHFQPAAQKRFDADDTTLKQLGAIKQHVQTIDTKKSELEELTELQKRTKEVLDVVELQRKSFVDDLLKSISGKVDEFYSRLHPDEALGAVRLYLDPNQRGSLKFEGKFETELATPPQAYYSESHLDTLGICIFLALAKKFSNSKSFVVIDDVFTSVDQVHLDRIIQLIHDEAESFNHLILTTHYQPWRDIYRHYRGPSLKVQLLELLPWTLQRGIRHTKTKFVVEELDECLRTEPMDRQAVASKAGILLEGLLDHLVLLYERLVPRRGDPNYTLGELMNAVDSKLKKTLKIVRPSTSVDLPPVEHEMKPILEDLSSITWIRNIVGCHYKRNLTHSESDVRQFGEKVRNFATLMVCEKCGELPRSNKTGVDRKCRCGRVHMLPVIAPE